MWRIMVSAVSVLAGCGSGNCELLHQVVAPSSSREPGTVQFAVLQSNVPYTRYESGSLAARSDDSVVCVTCSGTVMFDATLRESGLLDSDSPVRVTVAPDNTAYVLGPGAAPADTKLVALSPAGEPDWTAPIALDSHASITLVAADDGAYVGATLAAGDGSKTGPTIYGFDTTYLLKLAL